jgi:hypothetical protein
MKRVLKITGVLAALYLVYAVVVICTLGRGNWRFIPDTIVDGVSGMIGKH